MVARHSARESEGPSVSKAKDDEATAAVASVEDQALKIFLQGVEDEEEGKLYEAIVKYKKVRRRNIGFLYRFFKAASHFFLLNLRSMFFET